MEAVETEEDTTRLNVRVPTPLYERFKDKVESEGRTMTWVVLQAIRDYLTE
ncbi:ribbon-helix-helix protein, CopG family [Salinibacter ruber]|uniref:DNA-binding protein n=1 Tax=Salinibacter ruber TaxID=146919 RepID=A0A9X2QEQ1_9BACT|nr:ribbon-helix-helix protein, CopG family [Salinibacter ruber]MCS3662007.1 putative DNA-binding protein [Salinibacter ruber]MCS3711802.1 putative DNA-binding protein [Salinibacter ruber]MCS4142645.1 putative DNA-binding protein [Salinibacter ruber]